MAIVRRMLDTKRVPKIFKKLNKKNKKGNKTRVKPERTYTMKDAKSIMKAALVHYHAKQDGEFDMLFCLVDYKLVMNVEIKYQLDQNKEKQSQFVQLVEHSARQTNSHDQYFSNLHASIFGPGWRMLKVSIVLPGTSGDLNSICPHCRRFVITEDILKNPDAFKAWWKNLGLVKTTAGNSQLDSHYQEYLTCLRRIVGSMHVRKIGLSPWRKIMGASYNEPISTGFTERKSKSNEAEKKRFRDFKNKEMDSDHALFLTDEQASMLADKLLTKAILISDFGGGKIT